MEFHDSNRSFRPSPHLDRMAILELDGLAVPWKDAVSPENTSNMAPYRKQTRQSQVLPKGWRQSPVKRALPCDLNFDEQVEVMLRDGVKTYCDVFRPIGDQRVPAIVGMSPYGKNGHGFLMYENVPFRMGIPESATSGLEKFEGVDPAEWVPRGYAVVNVDIRGSWDSEGNLYLEGSQPGYDAYDTIEEVAAQPWCNGKVTMAGNSWLATTQWTAAIRKPPSLKCIAPWEGFTDLYRSVVCRGGIPKCDFLDFIFDVTIRGRHKREDIKKAVEQWPLMNAYWQDKIFDTSEVTIPIYAVASYSSAIHSFGTVNGYQQARSKNKWLRFHSNMEWWDLYSKMSTDDLQRFFDRYLKGIDNGWEQTPVVRISFLTFADRDGPSPFDNVPYSAYPPAETKDSTHYLTASGILAPSIPASESLVSYQSDDPLAPRAEFKHVFATPTRIVGYPKVHLWMSSPDTDDMDIYVSLRKLSRSGELLEHVNIPWESLPEKVKSSKDVPDQGSVKCLGPTGILRASHRKLSPISTPQIPHHPHDSEDKIPPGSIVPLEIGLWPAGIHFEAGEAVLVRVQGHPDAFIEISHVQRRLDSLNRGIHNIHVGGKYDSYIVIPTVEIK